MEKRLTKTLVNAIAEMALSYDGVLGLHDLVVHNYGPGKIFASIHIEVDAGSDLMEIHDMVDNIENEISKKLHILLTAHMDPIRINDPVVARMTELTNSILPQLPGVSNIHDLRVVPGPTHTNIIFDVVINPGCKMTYKEIQEIFSRAVKKENDNYFVVINFDKNYVNA